MRILLLQSSAYIPSLGGANKANRLLLEQLAARGHECQVIGTAGESRVESAERCLAGLAAAGVRGAATRPGGPGVGAFRAPRAGSAASTPPTAAGPGAPRPACGEPPRDRTTPEWSPSAMPA